MLNFIQNIDIFIIKQFYNFQHSLNSKLLNSIMIFFTNLGNHGLIWIAITLFLLSSKKYRKIGYLSVISLIINAIIVNVILKNLTHKARPFTEISDIILAFYQKISKNRIFGDNFIDYKCNYCKCNFEKPHT